MKCFLPICERDDSVSLHRFPTDPAVRQQWIISINEALRGEVSEMCPNYENGRVCSKHFKPECFSLFGTRTRLQHTAVPTLFQDHDGNFLDTEPIKNKKYTASLLDSRKPARNSANASQPSKVSYKSHSQQTRDSLLVPTPVPVPENLRAACRLCFAPGSFEPLYSGMIVVREEMLDRIYLCTGVLIVPKSKESAFICADCERTIKTFFSFRQQVYSNNLAYLEKKGLDELNAKKVTFKANRFAQKRHVDNTSEEVRFKIKTKVNNLEPFRIELFEKDSVPRPAPELIPNPLDLELEIKSDPEDIVEADPIQLNMTVECDKESSVISEELPEELPEQENWICKRCGQTFPFKFECAKHLLQKHLEKVESIKVQLDLDELNTNMLEMMSVRL
ncbi:uncharacterized protein LOC128732541 [Sabethes cyaneus]|uniref:uncharacterized protein LOC128732541 n=1 Tax=Sabethes cyaneus TaxID=53552 RepID=UPI00237EC34C|nr:uncharacterized protein LOC128732541 [Sabethes cyaneus]